MDSQNNPGKPLKAGSVNQDGEDEGLSSVASSYPCTPIAIVGMAMRLPGGVETTDDFWDMLINKRTGHCEIPGNRFSIDAFYSPTRPHSVRTKHGYFLRRDPTEFDASFFSIPPYEAARMDPQQRNLLMVVWDCLENAGETRWKGQNIGCYVGVFGGDWSGLIDKDYLASDRYYVLGTGDFALSNRVSYEYDFRGPSMTIETGCSASMVALHEACQALQSGQCSSAIVAGTNLIFSPTLMTSMSDNLVISANGMCHTFDNVASGYGRGEAVNAIYIKPLNDALRNHDPIRAVIRATATNSDGRTPNITTPGVQSQKTLIETTYRRAGIDDLSETGYFECHGTGTEVGDAAEVSVIAKLFREKGIIIGSVKPNVGHSEGASGITSIIKSALCLEQKVIPPTIYQSLNPDIPFEEGKLRLPSEPVPWPRDRKERISVNCFGIGGSNVHAILESHSSIAAADVDEVERCGDEVKLLVLSASSEDSLQARIHSITDFANTSPGVLADLAYTLGKRREHLEYRAFAVVRQNNPIEEAAFQSYRVKEHPRTLVFSGQGSQWPGMGRALMKVSVEFRSAINEMDSVLQSLPDRPKWSLTGEFTKDIDARIHEAHITQPVCTAFQIALFHVLAAFGLEAQYLVGHSSGEIAAAYAAGAITMRCAILLAYYRGVAIQTEQGRGSMYAVSLSCQEVDPYLREGVVVACINSPKSVTLSGDNEQLDSTIHDIKQHNSDAICKVLKVNVAYHSHHMTRCGRVYESLIASHMEHPTGRMLPFASSVACSILENPTELGASYWRQNLESPVLFERAVELVLKRDTKSHVFIELGPHSVLSAPLNQICRGQSSVQKHVYVPTILRGDNDPEAQLLRVMGLLHSNGISVKLNLEEPERGSKVLTGLPIYPWVRGKPLWSESRAVHEWRLGAAPYHELLGYRVTETPELEPTWRNMLSLYAVPWICDHVLEGSVVFPAAGYIAMAGEAVRQLFPTTEGFIMKNLMLKSPWIMEESKSFEVITSFKPIKYNDMEDSEWYSMSVVVHDGSSWTKHCQGQVRPESCKRQRDETSQSHLRSINPETWYEALNRKGLAYGPRFRGLEEISASPTAPVATASILDDALRHSSRYFVHPIAIDQCLQLLSVAQSNGLLRFLTGLAIPASIEEIYITYGGKEMKVHAAISSDGQEKRYGNVTLSTGHCVRLSLRNVFFCSIDDEVPFGDSVVPLFAHMVWTKDIDFVPSNMLLTPRAPIYSDPKANTVMQALNKIAILQILNSADIIISIEPRSDYMKKWKAYIMNQARIIGEGKESFFPESRNWVSIGADERKGLICKTLKDIQPIPQEFTVVPTMLEKVYENCAQFLLGTASPLEVFLEDNILEKWYAITRPQQIKDLLYLLGTTNPGICILEIGAGTGCATSEALKSLQTQDGVRLYSSYTSTDITPGFFVSAAEKFKDFNGLVFRTLDINVPPAEQGFELHSFDLVIASNAVHVTPSLQCSLKHVHDLLRPDGRLVLHELNPDHSITDFLMGVLPGWWLGEETDRRNRPFMPPERWDEELKQAGFTGSETAVYDNDRPLQTNFTMLSRPIECTVTRRGSVHIVYTGTRSIWMQGLSTSLVQCGYCVTSGMMGEEHSKGAFIVSLLDFDEPFFYHITQETFESLQRFLRSVGGGAILWLTHPSHLSCPDPRFGLIHGFTRTLRQELDVRFTVFEIDRFETGVYSTIRRLIEKIEQAQQFSRTDIDEEYVLHEGTVYVGRCHWPLGDRSTSRAEQSEAMCKKLDIPAYGLLETLRWCETVQPPVEKEELEIDVRYVGLNFRDLMVAMGLVGDRSSLGFEATGVVCRTGSQVLEFQPGDRVVFTQNGLFTTKTVANQRYCLKLPDGLGLEEASTMLSVYATVLYSLLRVGTLQAHQTVLIHSACGGVGQAAIHVCRAVGAKVYATVGNDEKVQYLIDHFGFSRTDIFNSRDESFVGDLMRETNGRGVDIVLNSLAGKLLHASWRCVAPFGKMIELGKRDFLTNGILDMAPFHSNRAFIGVDMVGLAQEDLSTWDWLSEQFRDWYREGKIKPIHPIKVFEAAEVSSAFRYLQRGTHIGKILVRMPNSAQELPSTPAPLSYRFSSSSSYLLVGGLGGLGRAVSSWMAERGASEIVYLSRSAGQSDSDQCFREELKSQGCEAVFVVGSATVLEDVQEAIARCTKPLAGVMLLSMVLRDQSYLNMSYEDWTTCLNPKVQGAWNLHHAVINHSLDFFLVFSSISAINGFPGQANYAAANSFLAAFTQHRRQLGLQSSILDLGPVEDVGIISKDPKLRYTLRRHAVRMLTEREFLYGVELAILQPPIPRHTMDDQDPRITNPSIVGLGTTRPLDDPKVRPSWRREDCRFALYPNMDLKGSRHELDEAQKLITAELLTLVDTYWVEAKNMGESERSGIVIDSLVAMEMRSWMRSNMGLDISLSHITKTNTIGGLIDLTIKQLQLKYRVQGPSRGSNAGPLADMLGFGIPKRESYH
ncbi:hypothetical protein BO82DRAFT_381420 [Aspergillus uvarum CBS 121591]|uniref:Uncharacterized protein n=1 Tax=Aspergillus uvarum CBS 121591 TaxID=1448315 RepID=A0A319E0J5_9EURO|nr:hypothetical protein BO82DRAFT_381420 [Aspergillus uvarum CBS 121591]PYH84622.1 hypothetical protein BO82DRAFT_381420 [Aspergillus uvarum CBS 121591]